MAELTLSRIVKSIIDNTTIDVLEKNLGLALQATKPAITKADFLQLVAQFEQIKHTFLYQPSIEIEENNLLTIACLLLNSSEVLEQSEIKHEDISN